MPIRSPERKVEVAWFSALCGDDMEYLGVPADHLRSNFAHCGEIVRRSDQLGYQNILLPSGFVAGQEPLPFAAALATQTDQINQLVAVRMGEIHPPMLARHLSTIDHIAEGRLTVNIISSDLPGEKLESPRRYARSREVIQILQQCWTRDAINFEGAFYQLQLKSTDAVKPYQQNGGPLLYFGGISPGAQALCAEFCDVFLMWPETMPQLRETMTDMAGMAAEHNRKIDFGLRIHMIVRETEEAARAAADSLISQLDADMGQQMKGRSQDSSSAGVQRQDNLRDQSEGDYLEDHVWSGIGRARSGCASAIVGDPDQVYEKIQGYIDMGIRAFIFSGYPHLEECQLFGKYVLPRLDTCKFNVEQGRMPEQTPVTPLTTAPRSLIS
mgnify:CR=1 FL=1